MLQLGQILIGCSLLTSTVGAAMLVQQATPQTCGSAESIDIPVPPGVITAIQCAGVCGTPDPNDCKEREFIAFHPPFGFLFFNACGCPGPLLGEAGDCLLVSVVAGQPPNFTQLIGCLATSNCVPGCRESKSMTIDNSVVPPKITLTHACACKK